MASARRAFLARPPLISSPRPRNRKSPSARDLRHLVEPGRAHQMSLELGQTPFRRRGEAAHQAFADHEPQDGVAQELQLLVIAGGRDLARPLVHSGFMRQRALEQFPIAKHVPDGRFENSQIGRHNLAGYCLAVLAFSARVFSACATCLSLIGKIRHGQHFIQRGDSLGRVCRRRCRRPPCG